MHFNSVGADIVENGGNIESIYSLPVSNRLTECAICWDEIDTEQIGAKVERLRCQHLFHNDCIEEWRRSRRADGLLVSCPLCRCVMEPTRFKQLRASEDVGADESSSPWLDLAFNLIFVPGGIFVTALCWYPMMVQHWDRECDLEELALNDY